MQQELATFNFELSTFDPRPPPIIEHAATLTDAALRERMVGPIGAPGLEGKQPAVVARAAVAQLLQQPSTALPGHEG